MTSTMLKQRISLIAIGVLAGILLIILFSSSPHVQVKVGNVMTTYFNPAGERSSQLLKIQRVVVDNPCSQIQSSKYSRQAMSRCGYHDLYSFELGINPSVASWQLGMTSDHLFLARIYIQTVKFSVINLFNVNYNGLVDGNYWPPDFQVNSSSKQGVDKCQAITMVGLRRIENVQLVLEDVIQRGVSGDFIETGVWKGGVGVFARAVLTAYKQFSRRVLLADSFEGIPPSNINLFPVDGAHVGSEKLALHTSRYTGGEQGVRDRMNTYFHLYSGSKSFGRNSNGGVQFSSANVNDYDNEDEQPKIETVYLVGYFKDSLPKAVKAGVIRCLAVLRLDGDLYESTWQGFENLYPYLNQGGVVIIDDFTDWVGAFQAVHDFRRKMKINTPIIQVYHGDGETVRGVYFLNPHTSRFC